MQFVLFTLPDARGFYPALGYLPASVHDGKTATDRDNLVAMVRYDAFRQALRYGDRRGVWPTPHTPHGRTDIAYLPGDPTEGTVESFAAVCHAIATLPALPAEFRHEQTVEDRQETLRAMGLDTADVIALNREMTLQAVMAQPTAPPSEDERMIAKGRVIAATRKGAREALATVKAITEAIDKDATDARLREVSAQWAASRARGLTPKGTPRAVTMLDKRPSNLHRTDHAPRRAFTAAQAWGRPTTTYRDSDVDTATLNRKVYIPGKD